MVVVVGDRLRCGRGVGDRCGGGWLSLVVDRCVSLCCVDVCNACRSMIPIEVVAFKSHTCISHNCPPTPFTPTPEPTSDWLRYYLRYYMIQNIIQPQIGSAQESNS